MITTTGRRLSILLLWILLLAGCQSTSPAVTYYVLTAPGAPPPGPAAQGAADAANLSIGVGPVNLPAYLDRPQIVTRTGPNQLRIAEYHRWAGNLGGDIQRVIAENLMSLTGSRQVATYPWGMAAHPNVRLSMEIYAFERYPDNTVRLTAAVTLSSGIASPVSQRWIANLEEPATSSDFTDLAAAQSRLLYNLSRQIAEKIQRLPSAPTLPGK